MRTVMSMMLVLVVAVTMLVVPAPGRAAPERPDLSRVHVMAVAPFADQVALSRPLADWGAARLSDLLARGPFQIVPPPRVDDAMQRLGIRRADLISPTSTVAVGQAVGADAVVTGRILMVQTERERGAGWSLGGLPITRVDLDLRVLEVGTRLNLFQDTFICSVPSWPRDAMECILRDAASRMLR
jgi:hypothetical protein